MPFWIDTVGNSDLVEVRIQLEDKVLRVFARRSQAYASNTHIFLVWMVGTSLVLLTIAILFLRNQIRPILQLAEAAESFGKGRPMPRDFRPRGAEEVRRAGLAFIQMRERIERQIEQRTAMLTGVSHDLRTILTRFKLQLALAGDNADLETSTRTSTTCRRCSKAISPLPAARRGRRRPLRSRSLFPEAGEEAELRRASCRPRSTATPTSTCGPMRFTRLLANLARQCLPLRQNRRDRRQRMARLAHRHRRRRWPGHSAG